MWTLEHLIRFSNENHTHFRKKDKDIWVPARPINYKYRTLRERFYEAYMVFVGKAEPLTWPEGQ